MRGGGVQAVALGVASSDAAGDARRLLRGGVHMAFGCPETVVQRLGEGIGWLHDRLRAAGQPGVVLVADELWALWAYQTFRPACATLWTSPLLAAATRAAPILGASGTFSREQVWRGCLTPTPTLDPHPSPQTPTLDPHPRARPHPHPRWRGCRCASP